MEEYQEDEIQQGTDEELPEPEVEEAAPEEEPEEEVEAEAEPVPKKKPNIGQRLSEVQRERYQALDEVRALREENERLRSLSDASTRTALNHYDQAVLQRLQAAKEQKIKALESGDIHAQTDADVALNMATAEYHDLNNLKAQQQINQENYYDQQQQPQQQYDDSYKEPIIRQWAAENSWFVPSSEDYDEALANEVHAYCNAFDNNLYRAGMAHGIMTPEYFQAVDEHINLVRGKVGRNKGELQMKSSRGTVAPVRAGYNSSSQGTRHQQQARESLTAEERDFSRRLGLDEKTYLQHKIADKQKNAHKRGER